MLKKSKNYCITPLAWVEIQCSALTAYCLHAYMLTCLHAYMLTYLHVYVLACLRTYTFERWHDSCLPSCKFTYSHGYMLVCLNVGMIHAYRQRAQLICGEFSTSAYRQRVQLRPKHTMTSLNHC